MSQEPWESDEAAIRFLEAAGYTLRRDWHWDLPAADYKPTAREISAIRYLFDEWDFGGIKE